VNHIGYSFVSQDPKGRYTMTDFKKQKMLAYMAAHDDGDAPDGAWRAMLEEAAEEWGRGNQIPVDGYEAFMAYMEQANDQTH
jgi:hypothetical protein